MITVVLSTVENALVAYGTLRPGEANYWVVRKLGGRWYRGYIRAWPFEVTWGAAMGYPGVVLDADAPEYEVAVLVSDRLTKHLSLIHI